MTDSGNSPETDESEPSIDEVLAAEPETGSVAPVSEESPSGQRALALRTSEANRIAARRRKTVLVLAGRIECGKTSAYAAIYERLGHGPFGGWRFSGSATIPGFEARCHYWRESAGVNAPGMKHTQASDLPWLHLQLSDVSGGDELDLLLGDFDGEFFDQLIKGQRKPSDLPFIRRADHVGLVVDGDRIADRATRPAEAQNLRYLADALLQDGDWAPPALLFVVTKLDCIEEVEDAQERRLIEETLGELHEYVAARAGAEVPGIRLAVRSETDRFPLGHGLEALLERLAARPASAFASPPDEPPARLPVARFRA